MTDASDKKRAEENDLPSENNLFRITDELVYQVDRSKKMILTMVVSLIIILPVFWHVAPIVSKSFAAPFTIAGYATVILAVAFAIIGVRQWKILSTWTSRYKMYKELQKKVDQELDFENQ
jgi:protein-S-isoprenylcysteine O-methyltransferase Ste14